MAKKDIMTEALFLQRAKERIRRKNRRLWNPARVRLFQRLGLVK